MSRSYKIVNASAGSIAESHLQILHELLEENSRDVDVLTWLGHRYTEKCEFEVAKDYYKRVRDLKTNKAALLKFTLEKQSDELIQTRSSTMRSSRMSKLTLPSIETGPSSGFKSGVTIEKINTNAGYSIDLERDRNEVENRVDFTRFHKHRAGSETVIYAPPEAGWNPGAELSVYNFYRSKQFSREAAQKKTLEHDCEHLYPDPDPQLYIKNSKLPLNSSG